MFLRVQGYPCNRQESRALSFSEEKAHWQIPMNEVNIICDVKTKDGTHARTHTLVNTFSVLLSQVFCLFRVILGCQMVSYAQILGFRNKVDVI